MYVLALSTPEGFACGRNFVSLDSTRSHRNMNEPLLQIVADELNKTIVGGTLVRVYQLAAARFALDVRASDNRLLFIAAEPARPRVYLIRRPLRSVEKEQLPPNQFALLLRKHLASARLDAITKDERDRLLRFNFRGIDDLGDSYTRTLVAALTGRSTNLFLLDAEGRVIDSLRPSHGEGQLPGDTYIAPSQPTPNQSLQGTRSSATTTDELLHLITSQTRRSPSEVIDEYDSEFERRTRFGQRAAAELARLRRDLQKRTKMERNLRGDLRTHGDPLAHKRTGDLLLANIATAEREGSRVRLTDYFAEDTPLVEIEIDENHTLQEAAARSFTRYTKAKRAGEALENRLQTLALEIADLAAHITELERIIATADEAALDKLIGEPQQAKGKKPHASPQGRTKTQSERHAPPDHIPGTRRYRSSDGFEIVVGRGARENDQVTFKLARPNDLWLHAADYPGAHVVIRNHTRGDVPHRTLVEGAQLAAFTSQAKDDSKVSVNYTARKFISKPKGAAPGLVRLLQFKTLLIEPREAGERVMT